MASTVSEEAITIGPEYIGELVFGAAPLVV
jgi:hypothetical protein